MSSALCFEGRISILGWVPKRQTLRWGFTSKWFIKKENWQESGGRRTGKRISQIRVQGLAQSCRELWSVHFTSSLCGPHTRELNCDSATLKIIGCWIFPGRRCGQCKLLGTSDFLHQQAKPLQCPTASPWRQLQVETVKRKAHRSWGLDAQNNRDSRGTGWSNGMFC